MEENVLTEIDATLKASLEASVTVGGQAVPVKVVTPDADLVEIEYPTVTLQLVDIRPGLDRSDNEFLVTKDLNRKEATVEWPEAPYDLLFQVAGHTEKTRNDRLLLEQFMRWVVANPILTGASGREYYISRPLTYREAGSERSYQKTLGFVVKARLPVGVEKTVPLVTERVLETEQIE